MNINSILDKDFVNLTAEDIKRINVFFIEECVVERNNSDRKGVYGLVQKQMAYNSNKIEGSTLTPDQTASLFDNDVVYDEYLLKDIEEMRGHFLMFNFMLDTIKEPLTEELIKQFHYQLKIGVFEDRANGYAIGDYKKRPNIVGNTITATPMEVREKMPELMEQYSNMEKTLENIALFHKMYEGIHPFQDGNGRTGRIVMFRECLRNEILPFIVHDKNKREYIECLQENDVSRLVAYFRREQMEYYEIMKRMLYRYF